MKFESLAILAAALVAAADPVKTAECNVACHFLGYDAGSFAEPDCACTDFKDYAELMARRRLMLPKRSGRKAEPAQSPASVPGWSPGTSIFVE